MEYGYKALTVKPERVPVAVVGVWSSYYPLATTSGGSITVPNKGYKYEDQYGNLISYLEYSDIVAGNIEVKTTPVNSIKSEVATVTNSAAGYVGLTVTATAVTASAVMKVNVTTVATKPGASVATTNDYTYTVAVAHLDDVTGLSLSDKDGRTNFYAGENEEPEIEVKVTGYYAGKSLTLRETDYTEIITTLAAISANVSGYNVTLDDTFKVVVNNSAGTVLTANVTKSNVAGKVTSASVYGTSSEFYKGYAVVTKGSAYVDFASSNLTVTDQYSNSSHENDGAPSDLETPRVTLSNLPTDTSKYTLSKNGTVNTSLTFNETGWYTIKATYSWADGYTYEATLVFDVEKTVAN
jgi:hypothetical protein